MTQVDLFRIPHSSNDLENAASRIFAVYDFAGPETNAIFLRPSSKMLDSGTDATVIIGTLENPVA